MSAAAECESLAVAESVDAAQLCKTRKALSSEGLGRDSNRAIHSFSTASVETGMTEILMNRSAYQRSLSLDP
jgi:hypothetical protein